MRAGTCTRRLRISKPQHMVLSNISSNPRVRLCSSTNTQGLPRYRLPIMPGLSISLTLRNESGRCHMTPVFIGCSGGRFLFGTARMFAVFRKPDRRREFAQYRRQCGRRHRSEHLPVGCRDRHHHAVVGLADLQRQIIAGHVIVALWLPMNTA